MCLHIYYTIQYMAHHIVVGVIMSMETKLRRFLDWVALIARDLLQAESSKLTICFSLFNVFVFIKQKRHLSCAIEHFVETQVFCKLPCNLVLDRLFCLWCLLSSGVVTLQPTWRKRAVQQ
ncbi:unnamed protein product [Laminaria digitata]